MANLPQFNAASDLDYDEWNKTIRSALGGHAFNWFSGSPGRWVTYMVEGGSSKDFLFHQANDVCAT